MCVCVCWKKKFSSKDRHFQYCKLRVTYSFHIHNQILILTEQPTLWTCYTKHHTNYKSMRARPGTKEERTRTEVSAAQSHHSCSTHWSSRTESSTLKSMLLNIPPAGVLYQTSFTLTERQHSLLCWAGKGRCRRVQMWTLQKNNVKAQLVSRCYNVKHGLKWAHCDRNCFHYW